MIVPTGFSAVTPYIFAREADGYVRFLREAFGGKELGRSVAPGGRIANCQINIDGATLMISEASADFPSGSAAFYLYVADAETAMAKAIDAGAAEIMAVADMPYGDCQGGVRDPAGNIWWISQRLTDEPYFR